MFSHLKLYTGKTGGGGDESEGTPVNIVNKALSRYTGFQYTLLLVSYDTFCEHSSISDIDEECDMEGERHLLSIHAVNFSPALNYLNAWKRLTIHVSFLSGDSTGPVPLS